MPKNKRPNKAKRGGGPLSGGPAVNSPQARQREIQRQMEAAERLWKKGDPESALEMLNEVLVKHPNNVDVLFMSAIISIEVGELQDALDQLELSDRLSPDDPAILGCLASVYLLTNNLAHALMAYRQLRSADEAGDIYGTEEREQLKGLEQIFQGEADKYEVMRVKMEQAMLTMERGELAALHNEPEIGIQQMQQAVNLLPEWSPARNNLSLYQWSAGQAEKAIETLRPVVDTLDPEDYQALSNLIHHLALAGRTEEARPYLQRLLTVFEKLTPRLGQKKDRPPEGALDVALPLYYKTADALAAMEDDQRLYELLKRGEELSLAYDTPFFRLFAAAAWNVGQSEEAQRYWAKMEADEKTPFDLGIQQAITRPRPPDALPLRIPYYDFNELVPPEVLGQMLPLIEGTRSFDHEKMLAAYARYKSLYPFLRAELQFFTFSETGLVSAMLKVLINFGTPEVIQALKDFALGVDGAEEARRITVSALIKMEQLSPDSPIRFWQENPAGWQEISLADFPPSEFDIQIIEEGEGERGANDVLTSALSTEEIQPKSETGN